MAEYATSAQIRAITKLCSVLRIREPLEERQMTSGEAGLMIRQLSQKIQSNKRKGKNT